MDKLARTDSSPRRMTREERPVHPCTRDLVFSLATCGSLFVLGSWSLTAVGCSAQAKTNEQRMAQRRNMNPVSPEKIAAKEAARNAAMYKVATSKTQPTYTAPARLTSEGGGSTTASVTPLTAMLDDTCNPLAQNAHEVLAHQPNPNANKHKDIPGFETATLAAESTPPKPRQSDNFMLSSAFTKEKYYMPSGMVAMRSWMPNAESNTFASGNNWNGGHGTSFASTVRSTSPANVVATANHWNGQRNTNNTNNANWNNGSGNTTELSQLLANAFAANTTGTMDPMRVWFVYSSLAVSNPDIKLPNGWSTDLLPAERDRVMAAHAGFVALGKSFRDGAANVDSSTRQALVAALTGEPALTIPRVDLCSKIVGYGDYSPIGRRNFLMGSNNRVIVYSELDGFKSNLENGKWTTRLATRVSIVPAFGSTSPTWCRTPEWTEVVDTADNQRREFFLGEIIPIGSTLSMGSYNVKVEVKDLTTGAVTSSIVPFKVLDAQTFAAANEASDNN